MSLAKLAAELGAVYGPLVVFVAECGLRTNGWIALERRDIDRTGAVVVQRRYSQGQLTPYPQTVRSRRRIPLTARALAAGISTFELSRLMGSCIEMIERTYGHLARDSEAQILARLAARSGQMGVDRACRRPAMPATGNSSARLGPGGSAGASELALAFTRVRTSAVLRFGSSARLGQRPSRAGEVHAMDPGRTPE